MIRLHSPYQAITQLPVLCGPACLAMVLARHGLSIDQEEVAQALGTYVRETEAQRYRLDHLTAAADDYSRLGIRLIGLDDKLNQLAASRGWPLSFQLQRLSEIEDLGQLIASELRQNHDVVANFWLNEDRPKRRSVGHFVVVEAIDLVAQIIEVVDPDPDAASPRYTLGFHELRALMDERWDGADRGVLIVKSSQ